MSAMTAFARRFRPGRTTAVVAVAAIAAELMLIAAYLLVAESSVTDPLILVYPLIWINVGAWAILTTTPPRASSRRRLVAAAIGVGYFIVLAYVGGLVSPGHALHGHQHTTAFRVVVASLPPGWSPAVFYGGSYVSISAFPFYVVGYLALSYLVYTTVLDAAGSAVAGLVGLFSCVSCTWPILGTVVVGVFGSGSAVVAFATNQPYGASTLVFLSAVALLSWRPLTR